VSDCELLHISRKLYPDHRAVSLDSRKGLKRGGRTIVSAAAASLVRDAAKLIYLEPRYQVGQLRAVRLLLVGR
jgi:hypothetical protein